MSNPYRKKNSEGRSHKHVAPAGKSDGGGEHELKHKARRAHPNRGQRGPDVADRQAPHKQRAVKELKHIDQGDLINDWVMGKRKSYK